MNLDSFYVTLPSNSSMNEFPNNTMSDYTTILPQTLKLDGKYEVALTELNFSPNISIPMGKITIPNSLFSKKYQNMIPFDKYDFSFDFKIKNGISDTNFCSFLNSLIEKHFIYHDFDWPQSFAYNIMPEIHMETISSDNIERKSFIDQNLKPSICLFYTNDLVNFFGSFNENSGKNIYFLIDSENSILSQIYLDADGKYLTNQNKWYFNEYSKLIDTFKITLIECEPKILENDEIQKRQTYLNYILGKDMSGAPTQNRKKRDTASLIEAEYYKRKQFFEILKEIFLTYYSNNVYLSINSFKFFLNYFTNLKLMRF